MRVNRKALLQAIKDVDFKGEDPFLKKAVRLSRVRLGLGVGFGVEVARFDQRGHFKNADEKMKRPYTCVSKRIGGQTHVDEHFELWLPISKIKKALASICEQDVDITGGDDIAVFSWSGGSLKMRCLTGIDPPRSLAKSVRSLKAPAASMAAAMKIARSAMSKSDSRFQLQAMSLFSDGKTLHARATDGHRLSWVEVDPKGVDTGGVDVLVPAAVVDTVIRFAKDGDLEIDTPFDFVFVKSSAVRVGGATVWWESDDALFPNCSRLFDSKKNKNTICIDRAELIAACAQAVVLFSRPTVALSFGSELHLKAAQPEVGELNLNVSATDVSVVEEIDSIGLGASYILDFLKTTSADQVELRFSHPDKATAYFTPVGEPRNNCIIMQVRLD